MADIRTDREEFSTGTDGSFGHTIARAVKKCHLHCKWNSCRYQTIPCRSLREGMQHECAVGPSDGGCRDLVQVSAARVSDNRADSRCSFMHAAACSGSLNRIALKIALCCSLYKRMIDGTSVR